MLDKSTKAIFKLGIRQKVLLVLMFALLSALTISGWLALQEEKENILKSINQRGTDISRFVAKSLVYSVVGYDYHSIDLLLKEIVKTEDVGYSKVVNLKGNTMAEAGILIKNDPFNMVIFNEKIILDDDVVGALTLGFRTTKTMQRLESQKFALIKREAFIILLIAIGEFIALSFIIIKPVRIISKSLYEREDENGLALGTIPITSNDEFGQLAKQFNELSRNLNIANSELQSRVDYADDQLIKTNNLLLNRSRELMDLNDEFKKLSVTDSLTGLFNRRYFEEVLVNEMEIAKRHADTNSLLVIDIDHFKNVNDNYGHMHGDTVIKMIAGVMKGRLRETDILCRIGGEEFVAICRRSDKEDAVELAEDLRKTVENQITYAGKDEIKVTISIGVETVTIDNIETHAENIFNFADIALYDSKEKGRNRVTHYSDMS
jgi:diguanylate cyclase (GGDEF)-like protein